MDVLAIGGIGTDAYNVLLLLHIAAAIVGFGGVILNGVYAAQAQKRSGPEGRAISEANFGVSMVAEKFIYAVPVLGLLLLWFSDGGYDLGDRWVWLSLVIYVVAIGISHAVLMPGHRKLNALLREMESVPAGAGGPPPQAAEVASIGKRLAGSSMLLHLALVVILVLMIWKPM